MKYAFIWLVILVSCLLLGCAEVKSHKSYDTYAEFSNFKTFDWAPGIEESFSKPKYVDNVKKVIETLMNAKGFNQASNNPDFLIRITRAEHFETSYATIYGPKIEVHEGKLMIQMLDGQSRYVVWEGIGRVTFSEKFTPEEIMKNQKIAAEKLLKEFPPK